MIDYTPPVYPIWRVTHRGRTLGEYICGTEAEVRRLAAYQHDVPAAELVVEPAPTPTSEEQP